MGEGMGFNNLLVFYMVCICTLVKKFCVYADKCIVYNCIVTIHNNRLWGSLEKLGQDLNLNFVRILMSL